MSGGLLSGASRYGAASSDRTVPPFSSAFQIAKSMLWYPSETI